MQGVVGTGWDGLKHFDVGDPENLEASGDPAQPKMWGRWQIAYGAQPLMCLDDDHAVTQGLVVIDVLIEAGASTALAQAALALYRAALADFEVTSNRTYSIETEGATETIRDPDLGQWVDVRLALPFKGL